VYPGGTVVDGDASPTALPVLHWFVEQPWKAETDEDTPSSVYFDGEFFDGVNAHRRGASRRTVPESFNKFGNSMTKVCVCVCEVEWWPAVGPVVTLPVERRETNRTRKGLSRRTCGLVGVMPRIGPSTSLS
jgi:hypothetical protein